MNKFVGIVVLLSSQAVFAQPDFVVDFGDPICRWTINPDSWLAKRATDWEFKAEAAGVTAVICTATAKVPLEKAAPPPPAARKCVQVGANWCYEDSPTNSCHVCTPPADEPEAPIADEEYDEEYDDQMQEEYYEEEAAWIRELHDEWHATEEGDL